MNNSKSKQNNNIQHNKNFKAADIRTLIGADNFRELIEQSTIIVGKTLLIQEFLEQPTKVSLITYPRRWGKGSADLILIDKANQKAAIIELKYNSSANAALSQIKNQEYAKLLNTKYNCLLIGINITPKHQVEVAWSC